MRRVSCRLGLAHPISGALGHGTLRAGISGWGKAAGWTAAALIAAVASAREAELKSQQKASDAKDRMLEAGAAALVIATFSLTLRSED